MKNILAQETITDNEVKVFLDEIGADVTVRMSRIVDSTDPTIKAATDDLDNLNNICNTISAKLEKGTALTLEEKSQLKNLLLGTKLNIERGVIEGVKTGIDKYLGLLE